MVPAIALGTSPVMSVIARELFSTSAQGNTHANTWSSPNGPSAAQLASAADNPSSASRLATQNEQTGPSKAARNPWYNADLAEAVGRFIF